MAHETDGFLSHTWLDDEEGRNNHERVRRLFGFLQYRGLRIWFDADRMQGDVVDAMCDGIDNTSVFVACITEKYNEKVGGRNEHDNCRKEFKYASGRLSAAKMLPVVMEQCMLDQKKWKRSLFMELGSKLYYKLTDDDDSGFAVQAEQIFDALVKMLPQVSLPAPPQSRVLDGRL